MANIFYGAAIQGNRQRGELREVHTAVLEAIMSAGHVPVSEHIRGATREETATLLDSAIGPLPPLGDPKRKIAVRRKMITAVESAIAAAIFECSVPSLGTGIEFAHGTSAQETGLQRSPFSGCTRRDFGTTDCPRW